MALRDPYTIYYTSSFLYLRKDASVHTGVLTSSLSAVDVIQQEKVEQADL